MIYNTKNRSTVEIQQKVRKKRPVLMLLQEENET